MNGYEFNSAVIESGGGGWWDARFARAQGSQRDWTPEKCAAAAERERQHKAWLATEEGADWFNRASWNKSLPCVRVRRLGWQEGLNGEGFMLYNIVDGPRKGSTVTLASLVNQDVRIEVVK